MNLTNPRDGTSCAAAMHARCQRKRAKVVRRNPPDSAVLWRHENRARHTRTRRRSTPSPHVEKNRHSRHVRYVGLMRRVRRASWYARRCRPGPRVLYTVLHTVRNGPGARMRTPPHAFVAWARLSSERGTRYLPSVRRKRRAADGKTPPAARCSATRARRREETLDQEEESSSPPRGHQGFFGRHGWCPPSSEEPSSPPSSDEPSSDEPSS